MHYYMKAASLSSLIKNGSNKRKVTSNEEISRLLQSGKLMFADEMVIRDTSVEDIDMEYYKRFFQRKPLHLLIATIKSP